MGKNTTRLIYLQGEQEGIIKNVVAFHVLDLRHFE